MKTYRHEIDGMRALAVISVILFHAKFPFVSGGFVGVDVFFVISGYLITSIIILEHENDTFSLVAFYERRARRILPALFFVLFLCVPFAIFHMVTDQLHDFAQGLITVTLGISNILFWMKEDYFSSDTELNPLVHTWSLAVEEQFYVLFALLFVVYSKTQHRSILCVIISVTIISLFLAQWSGNLKLTPPFITKNIFWFSQRDWTSFYLLTGRLWELLLGSLAAFYLHYRKPIHDQYKEIFSAIGLGLIVFATFYINENIPFPSFYTLIPTIGACLIIIYGNEDTYIGRILSIKIFRIIGLCSYSAYLWHQPLLAFAKLKMIQNELDIKLRIILVLVSLIFAYLSWWLVESPFRNRLKYSRHQIFRYAVTTALILDAIALGILMTQISPSRTHYRASLRPTNSSNANEVSNNDYLFDIEKPYAVHYTAGRFQKLKYPPYFNKTLKLKKLLIVGDSHAKDFVNMAFENGKLKNYQIKTYYIFPSCQMYIGEEDRQKFILPVHQSQCYMQHQLIDALPLINQSNVIILVSNWRLWAAERINGTIQGLKLRPTQKIIVVGAKWFSKANPKLYMDTSYSYRMSLRVPIPPEIVEINRALMKNLDKRISVDIQRLVCGANYSCPVFTPENRLISHDGSHTTKSGAKFVGNIIFRESPLRYL